MNVRKLCGALTLLLFVAPLGATLCGSCAAEHCMSTESAGMSHSNGHQGPRSPGENHCNEAEAPRQKVAPCHESEAASTASDACSMTASREPENAAPAAGFIVFEIALEASLDIELPVTEHDRSSVQRQRIPFQAPRSLYTLNSAFLI